MKKVILSADGDSIVYLVPDDVADNLEEYCLEFCSNWLRYSPDAEKYRKDGILCYTERDFIDYLNAYVFPECESKIVENLGWTNLGDNLPERYKNYPYFNF
jgi:hypothetical protein